MKNIMMLSTAALFSLVAGAAMANDAPVKAEAVVKTDSKTEVKPETAAPASGEAAK